MRIFITGVRGFLGSSMAQALHSRGHTVSGSASVAGVWPCIRLGEPFDPLVFGDAGTVIHAAHDFRKGALELNLAGARAIIDAARGRRLIFVSSHSARADAVSEYGVAKFRIEALFAAQGGTIVRPGLVIGRGGMFGRQLAAIRKTRMIPLVDGGRDGVAVIGISDFCAAMSAIVEQGHPGAYNLFNQAEPSMREIVETVLRLDRRRCWRIPVPFRAALAAVVACERAGVALAVNSESLRSLRLNRNRLHESDLPDVLPQQQPLEDAISAALQR